MSNNNMMNNNTMINSNMSNSNMMNNNMMINNNRPNNNMMNNNTMINNNRPNNNNIMNNNTMINNNRSNNNNMINNSNSMLNNNSMMNSTLLNNPFPMNNMNNMMLNSTLMPNYNPFASNPFPNTTNTFPLNPLLNTNTLMSQSISSNPHSFMSLFPLGMNHMPFPLFNPNLNSPMNQNFNNFNFIGINGLNNNNDLNNIPRANNSIIGSHNSVDLDIGGDNDYIKLKKQFIKELDEYQYKNKDKFDNALVEEECSICLAKYKITDIVKLLPCRHAFHKKCIKKWLSNEEHNKCPLCNLDIQNEINKKKKELEKHIYEAEHEDDD
jgi:hypothetical protein